MKKFTSTKQKLGQIGETLAVMFLVKRGFAVVERNYTKPYGEIDIVAYKDGLWHFVEVKTVSYETIGKRRSIRPEENMHGLKFVRCARTAEVYISEKRIKDPWQIDLITVYVDQDKRQGKVAYFPNIIFS